jgi:hypothetical protein
MTRSAHNYQWQNFCVISCNTHAAPCMLTLHLFSCLRVGMKVTHLAVLDGQSSKHRRDNGSHYFPFTYSIVYIVICLKSWCICCVTWLRYEIICVEYLPCLQVVILGLGGIHKIRRWFGTTKKDQKCGKILKQKTINLALQHSSHRNVDHDDNWTQWDWLA